MTKSIKKALEHLSNQTEWCIEPERLSGVTVDRSRQGEIIDQALKELETLFQQEIVKAREQAIEDVKYAGYGYDDGTGFVLKISYAELATLKEYKEL